MSMDDRDDKPLVKGEAIDSALDTLNISVDRSHHDVVASETNHLQKAGESHNVGATYVQQNLTVNVTQHEAPKAIEGLDKVSQVQSPIEVNVTVSNHGVIYKVGKWGWTQIDRCTLIHLRSNQPLYHNFIGTIKSDLVLLYKGHESIDKLDWLGHQSMPIRETLAAAYRDESIIHKIEGNFTRIRIVLIALLATLIYLFMGLSLDLLTAFSDGVDFNGALRILYGLATLTLIAYFYYAYAYHGYAVSHDQFFSKQEFHRALLKLRRDAWFPFFRE
ncbi:hypothetical protein [Vibrio coralliilyticus]|uniref:hypothetical protein n=1 Tax=Vibrio coralliilyticus TaxID=190893 RepID=UPI001E3489EF|nr:hypothetical protein [Vibrio coralliilyticus]MCC2524942.1 hypothetical protein [Vibrio coralliilyticus]